MRQGASRFHFERVCLSLATRFYGFRICPSLFAGELELCPEAEIILGTHRACAMYASAHANFALKMADSIRTSLVSAVPADGCEPIWNNSEAVKGSIVVVDRGACPFADQAMRAQAMGALAVVVVDNKPGAAAFAMPGNFSSVSIPATLITQEDGASLKDGLKHGATTLPIATLKIGPCDACTCKAPKLPSTLHAFRSPRECTHATRRSRFGLGKWLQGTTGRVRRPRSPSANCGRAPCTPTPKTATGPKSWRR